MDCYTFSLPPPPPVGSEKERKNIKQPLIEPFPSNINSS